MAMADAADGNQDLRLGGQNGALQWNRASDDATLPEQSPAGVAQSQPLPTNRWTCVEFMVDGAPGQLRTWVDGTASRRAARGRRRRRTTSTASGYNRTWRPQLTDLKLGWESYGGGADTLWYDDVAVGHQPHRLLTLGGRDRGPSAVPAMVMQRVEGVTRKSCHTLDRHRPPSRAA